MKNFSKRLTNIKEYIFAELSQKKSLIEKKLGKKVLDLSAGIPSFPPSINYQKKLKELINDPKTYLYPGYKPIGEFSQGLINWYKKNYSVDLEENEITVIHGGKDGVSNIFLVLTDRQDEVLVPDPGYPGFSGPTKIFGSKLFYYSLTEKNSFRIDFNDLNKKISKKTKFIFINYPSNPTGQIISLKELDEVVNWAKDNKIWIIYDNAYANITFDSYKAPSILQTKYGKEVAIEIGSFSKSFSFSGLRIGWLVGNQKIIEGFYKIKTQLDSGVPYLFQKIAGYAFLNFDENWHKQMINFYKKQRDLLLERFSLLGLKSLYIPKGSLYLWLKIPENFQDSIEYTNYLLEKKLILITPGLAFGKNGKKFIRVCFSVKLENLDNYF